MVEEHWQGRLFDQHQFPYTGTCIFIDHSTLLFQWRSLNLSGWEVFAIEGMLLAFPILPSRLPGRLHFILQIQQVLPLLQPRLPQQLLCTYTHNH